MESKSLGTLTLDLVARTAGFVQGMDAAERKSAKWRRQVKNDLKKVGGYAKIGMAAVATAALGAGVALTKMAKDGLASVDSQAKLARQVSGTINGLKSLTVAGSDAGVSADIIAQSAENLNQRLGEASRGAGTAKSSLDRLGLSASELEKMDIDERFATIADRMHDMGLSSAEVADELRQLGIRNTKLTNLMTQGGDAIRNARTEIDLLGISLSQTDAAKVEAANDAFARFSMLTSGFSEQLAVQVAPVIDAFSKSLVNSAKEAGGLGSVAEDTMNSVIKAAGFAADAVEGVRRTFAVAGRAVAVFALSATDAMLTLAQNIVDFPTKAVNGLISLLNMVPGVDVQQFGMSGLSQDIGAEIQRVRRAVNEGWSDIQDVLMQPWPSESIKQYVEEARAASNNVTATVVKNNAIVAASNKDTYQSLLGELDETQAAYNQYYEMVNRIGAANISAAEKTKLIGLAFEDLQSALGKETWSAWLDEFRKTMITFESIGKSAISTFTSSFGDAFEAMILDSQSLDEALRGIAETMLRSVVNAIGQMVAQWVAAAAVQSMLGTTATGTSVVQAGVTAAAWAPAAALASLATLGSNSAPASAALISTTSLSKTLALTGMAHDGIDSVPQTGTWLLEKGERVMTAQTSAKLDSKLNDMGSGATVNIYNAPAGTTTQQRTDDAGQVIIDVILADINSGGPIISGITRSTGTTRRGR